MYGWMEDGFSLLWSRLSPVQNPVNPRARGRWLAVYFPPNGGVSENEDRNDDVPLNPPLIQSDWTGEIEGGREDRQEKYY